MGNWYTQGTFKYLSAEYSTSQSLSTTTVGEWLLA